MWTKIAVFATVLCTASAPGWAEPKTADDNLTARPIEILVHSWLWGVPPAGLTANEQLVARSIDQISSGRFAEAQRTLDAMGRLSAGSTGRTLVHGLQHLMRIRRVALPGGAFDFSISYPPDVFVAFQLEGTTFGDCRTNEANCLLFFLHLIEAGMLQTSPDTPEKEDMSLLVTELQSAARAGWIEPSDAQLYTAEAEVSPKSVTVPEATDAVQAKCRRLLEKPPNDTPGFQARINLSCGDLLAGPLGPLQTFGFTLGREVRVSAGPRDTLGPKGLEPARYRTAAAFYDAAERLASETKDEPVLLSVAIRRATVSLYSDAHPPLENLLALAKRAAAAGYVDNAAMLYGALGALSYSIEDYQQAFRLAMDNDSWRAFAAAIGVAHSLSTYSVAAMPAMALEDLLAAMVNLPPRWKDSAIMRTADLNSSLARIYSGRRRIEPAIAAINRAIEIRENLWKASGPNAFPFDHVTYNRQADDVLTLAALLQSWSIMTGDPFSASVRNGLRSKLQALAGRMAKPPDIAFLEAQWRLFDNGVAIYQAYTESETCADFLKQYTVLHEELTHLTNLDSVLGIDGIALTCDGTVATRNAREIDRNDPMPELERYLALAKSPSLAESERADAYRVFAEKLDRFRYWIVEAILYDDSSILQHWGDRLEQAAQTYQWSHARLIGQFVRGAGLNIERKYAEALWILESLAANPESKSMLGNITESERIKSLAGLGRAEEALIAQEHLSESGWRTTLEDTGIDFSVFAASAELARLDRLSADGKASPASMSRRLDLLNIIKERQGAERAGASDDEIRRAIAGIRNKVVVLRYGEVGKYLYLWRIDKNGIKLKQLDGNGLLTLRLSFRLSWLLRNHRRGWENVATNLYRILIPSDWIPTDSRLIVIGDDLLGSIPFEVLGPGDGTTLLDTNVISYSRGLWGRSTFHTARALSPSEALIVGINTEGLSNAENEAVQIADVVGSESKTGPAAKKEEFERALANKQWVHLATHGALIPDSIYASYVSAYGAERIELWELLTHLRADVVVLSACDTFRGARTPGSHEEFGSIGQLILVAGAHSVIATLWKVDDKVVGGLMTDFYKQNGLSSADLAFALQVTKKQAAAKYKDPFYYASVVVWTDGVPIAH